MAQTTEKLFREALKSIKNLIEKQKPKTLLEAKRMIALIYALAQSTLDEENEPPMKLW